MTNNSLTTDKINSSNNLVSQIKWLKKQGKLEQAIGLCNQVIKTNPKFSWGYSILGELFAEKGNFSEAEKFLRVGANIQQTSPWKNFKLAEVLIKQEKIEEATTFLKKISSGFDDPDSSYKKIYYRNIANLFVKTGSFASLQKLIKIIKKEEKIIIDSFLETIVSSFWRDWHTSRRWSIALENGINDLFPANEVASFLENNLLKNLEVLDWDDKLLTEKYGCSKEGLQSIKAFAEQSDFFRSPEFIKNLIEERSFTVSSPWTNNPIKISRTIGIWPAEVFYFAQEKEISFYIYCHLWSQSAFIFYPYHNIVISLNKKTPREYLVRKINQLAHHIMIINNDIKEYLSVKKKSNIYLNTSISRYGDTILAYLWGLKHQIIDNLIDGVDGLLVTEADNFLDPTHLFPQFPSNRIFRTNNIRESQKVCYLNNSMWISVGGGTRWQNDDTYREHLRNISKAAISPSQFADRAIFKKNNFPVIAFGVVAEKRQWVSQVEGISAIINILVEYFPNIALIFDGMTSVENVKYNNTVFDKTLEVEKRIVKSITDKLKDRTIPCINISGCKVIEKLSLIKYADYFIYPAGSATFLVSSVLRKPGFVHGNRWLIGTLRTGEFKNLIYQDNIDLLDLDKIQDIQDYKGVNPGHKRKPDFGIQDNVSYDFNLSEYTHTILENIRKIQTERR